MLDADAKSSTKPDDPAGGARFDSFEALRQAHLEMMQSPSEDGSDPRLHRSPDQMRAFIARAAATGAAIADRTERRAAQGILDYWSAELVSAPEAAATDFLPARLALPDQRTIAATADDVPPAMDPKLQERAREIIRLAASARQYRDSGKQRGYLLYGAALKEASKYRDEDPDIALLIADSEHEEQRSRRKLVSGLLTVIALLIVFLGVAIYQWQQAETLRSIADNQRRIAEQLRAYAEQQAGIAHKLRDDAEQLAARIQDAAERMQQTIVTDISRQISADPYSANASSLLGIAENLIKLAGELTSTSDRILARVNLVLSVVDIYVARSDAAHALALAQEAKQLSQKVLDSDPNSEIALYALYRSQFRVGDGLLDTGSDLALPEYERALESAKRYASLAAGAIDRQSHIAFTLAKIGDIYHRRGEWSAAMERYEASLKVYEALLEQRPQQLSWKRDVATTLVRIGANLEEQGRFDDAIAKYQAGLSLLASLPTSNIIYQSNLSRAHNRLAEVYLRIDKIDEALKEYQDALEIRTRLVALRPNSPAFQNALAIQHANIGEALLRFGPDRVDDAIDRYQLALRMQQPLVKEAPDNEGLAQSLANTKDELGDALVLRKKYQDAETMFNDALVIRERLAKALPRNLSRQSRLVGTYVRIGDLLQTQGRTSDAVARYKAALAVVDGVLANPQTAVPQWQGAKQWETQREQLLGKIRKLT